METSATSSCQLWLPDGRKSYGGGRFIVIRKVNTHWSGIKVDTQLDAIIGFLTNYILSSLQQSRASRFDSYSAYYISLHSLIGKTRTDMRVRLSLQGWVVSTHKLTFAERNLPSLLRTSFWLSKIISVWRLSPEPSIGCMWVGEHCFPWRACFAMEIHGE